MNEHKINHQFIENYSKNFSEKLVDDFFASRKSITGKEIVTLTDSKQINFLIIKTLFYQWQEETKKLESPYFDFKNDKVRKALVQFMNTLSQHIRVRGEDLQPLLKSAVEDAIYLIFSPLDFYLAEISQKHPTHLAVKGFKSIMKYIKVNPEALQEFISVLEDTGKDRLEMDTALQMATEAFGNVETPESEVASFVDAVSKVIPFDLTEVFLPEETATESEQEEDEEPRFELDSYLEDTEPLPEPDESEEAEEEGDGVELTDDVADSLSEKGDEEDATDSKDIDKTVSDIMDDVMVEPKAPALPEDDTPSKGSMITNFDDDDIDEFIDTEDLPPVDLHAKGVVANYEEEEEEEPAILNQNFAPDSVPTLNDQLKSEGEQESLAGKLAKEKVDNIFSTISVNQRYMFTNELFGGNGDDFREAVYYIEECESFDDSVELLVQRYARPYKWDMNSVEVKELLKVIFRKFRD